MDAQVREILEQAGVAYVTGKLLDSLELQLHDHCYNVCPHLADDFCDFHGQLLTAFHGRPRDCLVSNALTGSSDVPINSSYADDRDAASSDSSCLSVSRDIRSQWKENRMK